MKARTLVALASALVAITTVAFTTVAFTTVEPTPVESDGPWYYGKVLYSDGSPACSIPVTLYAPAIQHLQLKPVRTVYTGPSNGYPPGWYCFTLYGAGDPYLLCARDGDLWAHAIFETVGRDLRLDDMVLQDGPHPRHRLPDPAVD